MARTKKSRCPRCGGRPDVTYLDRPMWGHKCPLTGHSLYWSTIGYSNDRELMEHLTGSYGSLPTLSKEPTILSPPTSD